MTPSPVGGSIHVSLPGPAALRAGESVLVTVVKPLDAGKWAVAIRGRVYPAFSELALEPGAVLRARVSAAAGKLVLTIERVVPDAVLTALHAHGIPSGGAEEIIARALARAGLPILPDTILKLKVLIARAGMDERKAARSAVTLVDKRIDPSSPASIALLRVLAFGQKGGEDPRRYRGRQMPDTPRRVGEWAASLPESADARPSALQAYNHSAARSQSWVVIPFVFTSQEKRLEGTLKILMDVYRARPLALSLSTGEVAVHLPLHGARKTLTVYADSERVRRAAARGLDSLRPKFHNMGLEVDDTIKEGNAFDGFSPVEEGGSLPRVDTVG